MTMSENISGLERFQKEKRQQTIDKVTRAIKILQSEGKEINFKSVSNNIFISFHYSADVPQLKRFSHGWDHLNAILSVLLNGDK